MRPRHRADVLAVLRGDARGGADVAMGWCRMKITKPTVVRDMPEADYHSHEDSLSASGAKLLAPPAPCPAKYRWQRDNPVYKEAFDFGHVAHRLVLGKGHEVEVLRDKDGEPFESYRTNACKEAEKLARAAGRTPILAEQYDRAVDLAAAVKADPIAGTLFSAGEAELSLFWPDADTGVVRRARFDWLTPQAEGRRRFIVDLKTARSSEPDAFGKSAADFGYAISAAQYVDGARACGLADDPAFLLVVVEKEPPHVVTVFQVEDDLLDLGRSLMRSALRTFAECTATDTWPGYATDVTALELPGYFIHRIEEAS